MSSLLPMPSEKQQAEDEREGRAASRSTDMADIKNRHHLPSRFDDDFDPEVEDDRLNQSGLVEVPTESFSSFDDSPATRRRGWFRMRAADDDEPQDWWFASTAIPLLAATIGPLANVLSIASIVGQWRSHYDPSNPLSQGTIQPIPDPHWEIALNAVSLCCGFIGNLFLLFNFTRAVRYIVALPFSILMWYLATGLLIGTLARMAIYESPDPANEIWGQPFWYAVMAATLYMVAAMLLMVNMLGYFLGHYTQHFELTDEQRNLILQTMMFFTWLAGGAGVFAKTSDWSYSDALYFCDVTILTVGFGDYAAPNDLGRGLVFPYSVGGIITLGLVIASISKFAAQIGHSKIVKKRIEAQRARTVQRSVTKTTSLEANDRRGSFLRSRKKSLSGPRPEISAPFDLQKRSVAFDTDLEKGIPEVEAEPAPPSRSSTPNSIRRTMTMLSTISEGRSKMHMKRPAKRSKLVILREERDRFNAMRAIQNDTRRFKRYFALAMSIVAFGVVWCVGAVVFWRAEHETQQLSYFQALYFCYVSLLTIGYGDLSPKSNAGKPFFVVWSLIAVPTMTILVSDLGDTVIAAYKRGTFTLADWSIMPKQGLLAGFLEKHPRVKKFVEQLQTNRRIKRGFDIGPTPEETRAAPSTIEQLAAESQLDEHDMAKRLARAIRRTADDMKSGMKRRYTYEEWVEFSRLIRFTSHSHSNGDGNGNETSGLGGGIGGGNRRTRYDVGPEDETARGLIEWDWIGADSPMMADQHECEWVLDRLCESLNRYMHKMVPEHVKERRRSQAERRRERMEGKSRRGHVSGKYHGTGGRGGAHKRAKVNGHPGHATTAAGNGGDVSVDASRASSTAEAGMGAGEEMESDTHDAMNRRRQSSIGVEHDGEDDQENGMIEKHANGSAHRHSRDRNTDDEEEDEGDDLGQMPGFNLFKRPGFMRKDESASRAKAKDA